MRRPILYKQIRLGRLCAAISVGLKHMSQEFHRLRWLLPPTISCIQRRLGPTGRWSLRRWSYDDATGSGVFSDKWRS